MGTAPRERISVASYPESPPPHFRFHLARALFGLLVNRSRTASLVTNGHTPDQAAGRAFAAELLVPASALRERCEEVVTDAEIRKVAQDFGVAQLLVEHQIRNHNVAYIEYE